MDEGLRDMHNGLRLTLLATLVIATIGTPSLAAHGQSQSTGNRATSTSGAVLPRKIVVPPSVVNRFFPEVTREASTGENLTAVGNPSATRSVIYANSDSSKKVTITVDQYASETDAASAYEEAVHKSSIVPGFKSISASNLGPHAFIGTVTQGAETHIGMGTLNGTLIVGATLVGYDSNPDTTAKLISLTRVEERAATAALETNQQK